MLLQAVEIGLNGICIGAFDKEPIRREFGLDAEPLLILALGKGIEKIVKIDLSKEEAEKFAASADAVRKTNNVLHEIKAI